MNRQKTFYRCDLIKFSLFISKCLLIFSICLIFLIIAGHINGFEEYYSPITENGTTFQTVLLIIMSVVILLKSHYLKKDFLCSNISIALFLYCIFALLTGINEKIDVFFNTLITNNENIKTSKNTLIALSSLFLALSLANNHKVYLSLILTITAIIPSVIAMIGYILKRYEYTSYMGYYTSILILLISTSNLLNLFAKGKIRRQIVDNDSYKNFFLFSFLGFVFITVILTLSGFFKNGFYLVVSVGLLLGCYQVLMIYLYEKEYRLKRVVKTLNKKAITDKLTSCENRDGFFQYLEECGKFGVRKIGFIILDIDNFKKINDMYGHDKGDYVLKEISKSIKETLRESDRIYRWGGEEFVIIIPNAEEEESYKVAEKARMSLNKINFENKITASFGISFGDIKNINDIYKEADCALYEAKKSNKNCTKVHKKILEFKKIN